MPDIADAFTWSNLLALSGPVLGYADGAASAWPPEAFGALGGRVAGLITVTADERHSILDSERGNAGPDQVATAIANRFQGRQYSTAYTNGDNCPTLTRALRAKGLYWTDAQFWPEPGCYLWAAAPGTTPGRLPSWCPVSPVAVQDRWVGPYDLSTTFHGWPFIATPAPPVITEEEEMVLIRDPEGHVCSTDGAHKAPVDSTGDMQAYIDAGIKVVNVSKATFDAMPYAR